MKQNTSAPNELEVQLIFTNFFASSYISDFVDIKAIKKYCNDLRVIDPIGIKLSNRLGWQSQTLNLNAPDSSLVPLIDAIEHRAKSLYTELSFSDEYEPYVKSMWININGKYHYNKSHDHPFALFAGCFYVNCPGPEDVGRIRFENPNRNLKYYLNDQVPKYGQLLKARNHLTSEEWHVIPEEGKLLLFPGWLFHSVDPNLNDEDRISIAFNIQVRQKQNENY